MDNSEDYVSITNITDQYINAGTDTITLNSLPTSTTSVTLSPSWTTGTTFTYSNISPTVDFGNLTTGGISGGISGSWGKPSGKITLTGEDADIDMNGISLKQTLQDIQDRLNILRPNKSLEAEWDQLRVLGEQYRELEKKLTEQSKMWDTLKKMPPPEFK